MMSFVAMVTQPLLHLIYRLSESFAMGSESRKIVLVLFHELLLLIEEVERLEAKSFCISEQAFAIPCESMHPLEERGEIVFLFCLQHWFMAPFLIIRRFYEKPCL